jgi:2-iminobutanoate/2-iminopropanoate deaminase
VTRGPKVSAVIEFFNNAEYVTHFPNGLPARHTARFGVPTTAKVAFACIALASD